MCTIHQPMNWLPLHCLKHPASPVIQLRWRTCVPVSQVLFPFYINQNIDLWANCVEASQGGFKFQLYFAGKSNVAQVKLMLSLSMHEIMWCALGIVKFLTTGYGAMCRETSGQCLQVLLFFFLEVIVFPG